MPSRNDLIFIVEVSVEDNKAERDWRAFLHFNPFFTAGDALTAIEGLPNEKILRVARYLRVGIETKKQQGINPLTTTVPEPEPGYVENLLRQDYDGKPFPTEAATRTARTTIPPNEERIAVALEGLLNAFTRSFPSPPMHAARERLINEARKLGNNPDAAQLFRLVQAVQDYDNTAGRPALPFSEIGNQYGQ